MIPISQMKTMTVRREERNPDTIKQKAKGCNGAKKKPGLLRPSPGSYRTSPSPPPSSAP